MDQRQIKQWGDDLEYGQKYIRLPPYVYKAIRAWVLQRQLPGHFVAACLRNDFADAVTRADEINSQRLRSIAEFLMNYVPPACWGSGQKMKEWAEGE